MQGRPLALPCPPQNGCTLRPPAKGTLLASGMLRYSSSASPQVVQHQLASRSKAAHRPSNSALAEASSKPPTRPGTWPLRKRGRQRRDQPGLRDGCQTQGRAHATHPHPNPPHLKASTAASLMGSTARNSSPCLMPCQTATLSPTVCAGLGKGTAGFACRMCTAARLRRTSCGTCREGSRVEGTLGSGLCPSWRPCLIAPCAVLHTLLHGQACAAPSLDRPPRLSTAAPPAAGPGSRDCGTARTGTARPAHGAGPGSPQGTGRVPRSRHCCTQPANHAWQQLSPERGTRNARRQCVSRGHGRVGQHPALAPPLRTIHLPA